MSHKCGCKVVFRTKGPHDSITEHEIEFCLFHDKAEEMRDMLEEIEWFGVVDGFAACPVCDWPDYTGHHEKCKLKALLDEIGETK